MTWLSVHGSLNSTRTWIFLKGLFGQVDLRHIHTCIFFFFFRIYDDQVNYFECLSRNCNVTSDFFFLRLSHNINTRRYKGFGGPALEWKNVKKISENALCALCDTWIHVFDDVLIILYYEKRKIYITTPVMNKHFHSQRSCA